MTFGQQQHLGSQLRAGRHMLGDLVDELDLVQEPGVDPGGLMGFLDRQPTTKSLLHQHDSSVGRCPGLIQERLGLRPGGHLAPTPVKARARAFQRAKSLLQGLGEVAADRHRLADALHGRGQRRIRGRKLLEGEPRHLDHDVVQGRLEAGRRDLGDVVADLVQGVADGQLRGDLGNRETGCLRGQRRGPGDPRVHLDDDDPAVARVDRELDVAATGVDPNLPNDGDREVPQPLVLTVGQGQRRCHGDGVTGVHPHRVQVLDRADDHHVVGVVTHHLELVLLPPGDGLLQEHLGGRRVMQTGTSHPAQVGLVMGET